MGALPGTTTSPGISQEELFQEPFQPSSPSLLPRQGCVDQGRGVLRMFDFWWVVSSFDVCVGGGVLLNFV